MSKASDTGRSARNGGRREREGRTKVGHAVLAMQRCDVPLHMCKNIPSRAARRVTTLLSLIAVSHLVIVTV
jgi:hypothetical protein